MKIVINGAFGRMGRVLASRAAAAGHEVVYGADIASGTADFPVGARLGDFRGEADIVIDFSLHGGTAALCEFAAARNLPAVIATTGQTEEEKALIAETALKTPVFLSANMSVGVALLCELCAQAAAVLKGADVEIIEKHHNRKADAPSGTALTIAEAVRGARGGGNYVYDRHSVRAPRSADEIGIHSVRAGNIVGEHEVLFALGDEHIRLSHSAFSREIFADGALKAAAFLIGRAPGLYGMKQLLGGTV